MNTSSLRTFAQNARKKIRAQVAARLNYWVGPEKGSAPDTAAHRQFAPQIKELAEAARKEGRDTLVERVSYTWFNRLVALRYMDANGYHPFGAKVVSPATPQEILPEVLQHARAGELDPDLRARLANPQTFDDLLAGRIPGAHPEAEAYAMLLLAVCNYYYGLMPFLFEKLGDATQLLLPEDLLSEQSILSDIRQNLEDEDCGEIEIIGWLYQFYISEKKAEVDDRKKAVPKEDIPAVTQLFTPHWIVRYLVENSLGRLWLLNNPQSKLRDHMPYYIDGQPETDLIKISKPEDIKLLDPAVGSGHMLTYAFDLLYRIYDEEGYDVPEIPSLILRHNLHGLEICNRAAPLAAFALCMKARNRDKRFFRRLSAGNELPRPRIVELRDVSFAESELQDYIHSLGMEGLFSQPILKLLHQFEESKSFGSLIQPCLDENTIGFARRVIEAKDLGGQLFLRETHLKVLIVLEQAEALTQRYHVVVANPPYLKGGFMSKTLKRFAEAEYPQSKANLYAMFLDRCLTLAVSGGLLAMVNLHGWMFTVRYEKLRKRLLSGTKFITMAHLGANGFDEISGEVVQTTAFALQNTKGNEAYCSAFFRLVDGKNEAEKNEALLARKHRHLISCARFVEIEGSPMAYWLSDASRSAFQRFRPIEYYAEIRAGLQSGDNQTFLRYWHEVQFSSVGLGFSSRASAAESGKKWFPHNKGGLYRRWYGNGEYLLLWENDGEAIKARKLADLTAGRITPNNAKCWNQDYYFVDGFSWTALSTGNMSARDNGCGYLFDTKGQTVFPHEAKDRAAVLGYLNSSVSTFFLEALSPTLDFNGGTVGKLPLPVEVREDATFVASVKECVSIARADWDNFEGSWDFRDEPLLRPELKGATLEASWRNWAEQSTAAIRRMQKLETGNNQLLIAAYGLHGELQPEVPEDEITLGRANRYIDMAAFISFAVGCMMGRYSLDQPGLILADAGATEQDYLEVVPEPTFAPDADGILPVLGGEWFPDDIVSRFREFLRVTFGDASIAANLRFIEDSLGKEDAKTGKVKSTDLRTYFFRDFYRNHISSERAYGYKKRPIYWMVSSPGGAFQALIYLHRYTRDTLNRVLDGYVRPFLEKLERRQQECTVISNDAAAKPAARTQAARELLKLAKMINEIRNWERDALLPLAQRRIELDLNDGVKINYLKFKGVLVPIPSLEKKIED